MKMNRMALAAAVLVAGMASQADAAVMFDLRQQGGTTTTNMDGTTSPGRLAFSAQLMVTDAAYDNGFTFQQSNGGNSPPSVSADGLLSFTTYSENAGMGGTQPLTTTWADYTATQEGMEDLGGGFRPGSGFFSGMSFAFDKAMGLVGGFYYNNSEYNYSVGVESGRFSGTANSDFGLCYSSPGCTFAGSVSMTRLEAPTAVPEPASMALFGMGLLGMGLVRRRRAVA